MDKRSLFFVVALSIGLFFLNHFFDKPLPPSNALVQSSTPSITSTSQESASQELFVLENATQQIVFSTLGGSISEINLPFHSNAHEESLVLPIAFDKTIAKHYVYNDRFPSHKYWIVKQNEKHLIEQGEIGGYYPLLRRSILGKQGDLVSSLSPKLFAFTIVSDQEELTQPYEVTAFTDKSITFTYKDAYRKITKTFTLADKNLPYCFDLDIRIEGDAKNLWLTTGLPEVEMISNQFSPSLKYLVPKNGKNQAETLSLPKNSTTYSSIAPTWISNSNGFFGIMTEPLGEISSGFKARFIEGALAATRISLIDAEYQLYPIDDYPSYEMQLPLKMAAATPLQFRIFAGPYQSSLLKEIDYTIALQERNPSFVSTISLQGWFTFISEPFSKLLFLLMKLFYQVTHSWGFSIILLTVALRVMLYPLNEWSIKSTTRMQQIAPLISELQSRHKKDPKRAQMEMLRLYKEHGVNPMTGCLPLLIQIPFLIGMFDLLKSTFELRGASFIPGWISNLTAPDIVFSWNYPLFFIGTSFHALPILLGVVMFLQQNSTLPMKTHANTLSDAQRQQRVMGNIMVIVFTVISYHFPSGLNIYWLSSMGLQMLQQWYARKSIAKKSPI